MGRVLLLIYLLILSVFDGRDKAVGVMLIIPGVLAAFGFAVYKGTHGELLFCMLGLLPGIILEMVSIITRKAGRADGIVLGVVGVLEGYRTGMLIWGISMFFMSVAAVVLLCCRYVKKDTRLPYIPFLCGGYLMWNMILR